MIRGVVIIAALARPMNVIRAVHMQLIPEFWGILACCYCRCVTSTLFEVLYNGPLPALGSVFSSYQHRRRLTLVENGGVSG